MNPLTLFKLAAALLYLGPLLAGVLRQGWQIVPVFVTVFLLWLVVIRPQDWPAAAAWRGAAPWLALFGRGLVQLLLVVLCIGLGRGLAGVSGLAPDLPAALPVALSILAVGLGRMAWNPGKAAEMDLFLDQALDQIAAATAPPDDGGDRIVQARVAAMRLTATLADLPDRSPLSEIEAHLMALAPHLDLEALFDALQERQRSAPDLRVLRAALVLAATDPFFNEACRGRAIPLFALRLAEGDGELTEVFARRCIALLEGDVDAWGDCPNTETLQAARVLAAPAAAAALADLLALNRRLAPLNGLADVG